MKMLEDKKLVKNKLISIGWIGNKRCYLNIEIDEAIRRYCESEMINAADFNEDSIDIIEFEDEFGAYSIYE